MVQLFGQVAHRALEHAESTTMSFIVPSACRSATSRYTTALHRRNLARYVCDRLTEQGFPVSQVDLYETPNNCAIYRRTA